MTRSTLVTKAVLRRACELDMTVEVKPDGTVRFVPTKPAAVGLSTLKHQDIRL